MKVESNKLLKIIFYLLILLTLFLICPFRASGLLSIGDLANKTTVSEYKTSLKYFYNTLDSPGDHIFSTNLFDCGATSCKANDLNDIGLLSLYEYNKIGGLNSYIDPYVPFYIRNSSSVNEVTNSGIKENTATSGMRPVIYLKEDTVVTGMGTVDDPYVISEFSDLNIVGYTVDGNTTDSSFDYLLENNVVRDVTCLKGTPATWDYDTNSININSKEVIYGDYCTINFKDGFAVSLSAGTTGVVSAPVSKTSKYNGTLTFKVTPNPGYTNELEENTCAGTLNGNVLTISGIKDNKICEIKFKKETYTLTLDAGGGYFGNPTEIDDGFDDAVALTKGTSYPVATGRTLSLKRNTKYMLSYDYKSDSTNIMFNTDLFPDTLPEIYPTAKTEWQTMNWVFSSSSSSMTSATIRYFNDRTVPNSDNIYIVNKHLYECADCTTTLSKSIEYNGKYGTLPTPKRNEWKFLGWYTTSGVKVDKNTSISSNSNQKLIAKWEKITYELKLNAINGKVANSPIWYWFGGWESSGATLTPNDTYTSEGATVTCDGGAVAAISNGVVYFSKVNKSQTCTITFKQMTLLSKVLSDNPTRLTRSNFTNGYGDDNIGTLFTSTERVGSAAAQTVYYYSGNALNNWVKFGKYQANQKIYRGYASASSNFYQEYSSESECKSASKYNYGCYGSTMAYAGDDMYWRIIRTNADGSVRMVFAGNSPDTTKAYIGISPVSNIQSNDTMYVGYKYGTSGSLANNRLNTNDSTIKKFIENWYKTNLTNYTKYLSNDAVYCNDRSIGSGTYSVYGTTEFEYGAYTRLDANPTFTCPSTYDAFSVNNLLAKLTYPIGLMTADEVVFAGGVYNSTGNLKPWYTRNSKTGDPGVDTSYSIVGAHWYWSMSPAGDTGSNGNGYMIIYPQIEGVSLSGGAVRPVISLKGDLIVASGNGSVSSPYQIVEN